MDASIVITTYDRPLFLKRAIESCLNQQTSYSYEIIVIDDNGLDTAIQKVTAKLLKNYPEIVYIPLEKNSGACRARNVGVENAKGDYIFFLDDDDEFLNNRLDIPLKFLSNNKNYHLYASGFLRFDNHKKLIKTESNYPKVGDFKNFVMNGNLFNAMVCLSRKVFLEVGGFDDIPRFQDRYLYLKILNKNFKVYETNIELCKVYEHSEDRISKSNVINTITSLDIIKKYIELNKKLFSHKEWDKYLIKDYRMRATSYYTSNRYLQRVKAILFYFKSFLLSKEKKDIIMIIKSIVKI